MQTMYYIGLDVHKRKISYCVKDPSGAIHSEGSISATRFDLDRWMKTLPQPWRAAIEATMFTGWIYDHLKASRCRLEGGTSLDAARHRRREKEEARPLLYAWLQRRGVAWHTFCGFSRRCFKGPSTLSAIASSDNPSPTKRRGGVVPNVISDLFS